MPASLNIKNQETYRLIRELADATGESMTEAVTVAVRERLARTTRATETRQQEIEARIRRMTEIADEMRRLAPAGYWDQDFDELLYDEDGLPK
jgi:antitoxin VapB